MLKKSIEHWKDIVSRLEAPGLANIPYESYHSGECPLCQKYLSHDTGASEAFARCWACPLAYHSWIDSGKAVEAFSGQCCREWRGFADSMRQCLDKPELYYPTSYSSLHAIKMLEVLEELDEEQRFKKWEDFKQEVLQ